MLRSINRAVAALLLFAVSAVSCLGQQALQQSSTSRKIVFLMVDSTDHVTGKTGLTVTVTLSKNGGAFGAPAGTVAELSSGWYVLTPTSADTGTLGPLLLHATGTAADPTDKEFNVVAYNPDDSVRLGLTSLPNAAAGALNGLPTGDASGRVALQPMDSLVTQSGTVQAGAASTVTLAAGASATDSLYVGSLIKIYSGTGSGQVRLVTAYNGTTKVATVGTGWTTQPVNGDSYAVLYFRAPLVDASGYVTVGSNQDKTGYSLTQAFPTNFSSLAITGGGAVTAGTVSDKTGYALSGTQTFNLTGSITGNLSGSVGSVTGSVGGSVNSVATAVTVGTNQDKTGYSLVQTFPTNFSSLLINAGDGGVTLHNNLDKTGYALTQAFPTNFSVLSLDSSGRVTFTPAEHALLAGDVFNSTATSYNAAGSLGQKLNSAASAGDPLSNAVPGGYASGTAGYKLGQLTFTGTNVGSVVNAYASGQDPATLVLAVAVDGSLTMKQMQALSVSVMTGKFTITRNTSAKTITVVYYRADGTTVLATMVTNYSDTALTLSTGRTVTYSNLP